MNLKNKVKNKINNKIKKVVFKAIKPFLPFIIIIVGLFFAICTIIDAVFIQEVQSDSSSMSSVQLDLKNKCIEKAEYLNTCNNYINDTSTLYLLDIDNREDNKKIEWSHLYSIMVFHNLTNHKQLNVNLLNEVSKNFKSTFKYEQATVKIETLCKDENGNDITQVKEDTIYILIESDTIIGHYKYNYKEQTVEKNNIKTTKKVFISEELIGEKYNRLKNYLKNNLHIKNEDIETNLQIVIQAANGYYEGTENISWLQNSTSSNIITDGKGLIPTRNVYLANSWLYKNNFSFRNENTSNYSEFINYIVVLMYGAPIGVNFVAMADGTVIKAVYSSSYGNMVMIDHR